MESKKRTFTDFLSILYKWKKLLFINLLIIAFITLGITFLIPEKFKANSVIMLAEENSNMGALGNVLSNVGSSFLGSALLGSSGTGTEKLFGYLESRKILLNVVDKFNLIDYYDITSYKRDKVLKALRDDAKFDLTENGLLEISMIHEDPEIAASIVNYFVEVLDSLHRHYSLEYATSYRKFVEKRYFKNLDDLSAAEVDLKNFQEKYKVYVIPEQFELTFQVMAKLESELALKELQLDLLKNTQGINTPTYKLAEQEAKLLKEKLNEIEKGKYTTNSSVVFFKLDTIPTLQREYFRIYRNLEVQSKLLEYTLPIYEQAVMEEQKNLPNIIVLDEAIPPQLKYSPKKSFIILSVLFLAGLFFTVIIIRSEQLLNKKQNQELNIIQLKELKFYSRISSFYKINAL
ncbi:MAG: hypothetical protein K8F36_04070 [Melioribacteraceae bacterium]|nr:hypothetical protein [Melioribacteraceae bacterium]MCO6473132.1 hypothetical protein [Melioribacteraceae bacterium]MDD3557052.1 hypothetical protein [Melioribacteraceae bacterium]